MKLLSIQKGALHKERRTERPSNAMRTGGGGGVEKWTNHLNMLHMSSAIWNCVNGIIVIMSFYSIS